MFKLELMLSFSVEQPWVDFAQP